MTISENRRHLMDAALPLFAEKGYHKTKISDIVKKTGVAQGTFYWHFKNKEDIVLCILKEGEKQLLKVIHSGYREKVGHLEDMIASSTLLMTNLFAFAKRNSEYMQLLFKTGQDTDKNILTHIEKTFVSIEKAFEKNIARAQELHMLPTYYISKDRAAMLVSLIFGMLERWLFSATPPFYEKGPEQFAAELVEFEFFGLQGHLKANT
ncbi:TetR/AcrR family transcriptional regulator [Shouchella patagoniensis]|uniref:TetR/AcrR family transcriptional regulator n=1 Tax=Shouchella patagoniensis TaxID=228576 RepID=UPI001FE692A2|nr:TetR/AcrR family transcriptional regulator [Shouchella patagoniensis]